MTDREKVKTVFAKLRKAGWFARMNFMCCSSCGWAELSEKYGEDDNKNIVFYNKQSADAFDINGNLGNSYLPLQWSGNAREVVAELALAGFGVEWDGTADKCVMVKGNA